MGICIAIGIHLKVVPVAYLGYLVWRGRWKAAWACLLGFHVALTEAGWQWTIIPLGLGYGLTSIHLFYWPRYENPLLLSVPCLFTFLIWTLLAWQILEKRRWAASPCRSN